ncbi:bifunctional DNA primase/polymerase [Mycolicibacterium aubagnense]|uniref:DNA primase/polymerase bifunctional N-terminal domain-containing protein n=1 Tax=Mycolicibacterium aubagnense TaxID=319707 RepID=A0ABN5Z4J7_9MYCO|nr:bifunctional DNA primase/polymerase [Mycolicibacterium aubagnense]TLH64265.1 DNA primase [Mycolicibacterium aubagnense]BBX87909.1 hypothetical protein MAUB_57820 [Mycolicibacterium aubagnense]
MSATTELITRMVGLGAHLMPLMAKVKRPGGKEWQRWPALSVADAESHVNAGGNLGVNLAPSRMIVLDAENQAATNAVQNAGISLAVIPAKSQHVGILQPGLSDPDSGKLNTKTGGSHAWLRVPDGVDISTFPSDTMGIMLPGGGKIDVLAGVRYAVAPPSWLEVAPQYRYAPCEGGPLDLASPSADLPVAPAWLFDTTVPVPPGLEPLHGILIPKTPRERLEADARSIELTAAIDAVPWDAWLDGDPRLTRTGDIDGCGCEIWHWVGADNLKSATLHENCAQGSGAHIWSGTMLGQLQLPGDHVSRLALSAKLRGVTVQQASAAVGITLGGDREPPTPVRPEHHEQAARLAEAAGEAARAERFRAAAEAMRKRQYATPSDSTHGERHGVSAVVGGAAPIPPELAARLKSNSNTSDATARETAAPQSTSTEATPSGSAPKINGHSIVRFPGKALAEIPIPGLDEIYEYPMPPIPAHVKPVKDARTEFAAIHPPVANRQTHTLVEHEWIFAATPGLSHVAAAADSRGVGRWGMLGALLPRVAATIPPTVRLIPADGSTPPDNLPTGSGTSLNLYTVLVGPPAAGKSVTLNAADALVPGVHMVPPGTGEGILKIFPRATDNAADDEDDSYFDPAAHIGSVGATRASDSVLLSSDEIDVFVAEMSRQGTKASGLYRSMWMGGDVGNTTSDKERHSMVLAHTYRFGIRLGAQPDAVAPLFSESDRGTPQRFLWLGCQRMIARGGNYPSQLATAPVYWYGGQPSMLPSMGGQRPPVWIAPPPAARKELEEEQWRSATANPMSPSGSYTDASTPSDRAAAIADRHALLQQLKICAILAVLDGLAQPQDVHWYAAEAVMKVRRTVIFHLVEVAEAVVAAQARQRGTEMGIMRAHADAASVQELAERRHDAEAAITFAAFNLADRHEPLTVAALRAEIKASGSDPGFVQEAVTYMVHNGDLTPMPDGRTYALTLGNSTAASDGRATVTVLPVAPAIANVGSR